MSERPSLLVIAKAPVAGRVKTRLVPPLTPHEAAYIAEAALRDTLSAVARTPARRHLLVLDGEPGPWRPAGFELLPQRGSGLAERLAAAFEDAGGPALLVGMDTPQVSPDLLERGLAELGRSGVDAVLGPAADGGYWAIGLRRPDARVFADVPMSAPSTADEQRRRLSSLSLRWCELPGLRDVDSFADAQAVARQAPRSRFARALARVVATRPVPLALTALLGAIAIAGCGEGENGERSEVQFPPAAEPPDSPPARSQPAGRVKPVGAQPEGLAVDPETAIVAVGLRNPDRLALVAAGSGRVLRRVPLPSSARHLSLAALGGPVLVPAERADVLLRVSLPGGRQRATRVGRFPHDAAATAGRIFVGDELGNTVSVIEDGRVVESFETALQPGGVAATGTGEVAVVAVRERVIETFGARTLERAGSASAGVGPTHVVSDGRGTLYVADTDGRALLAFRAEPEPRLVERARLPSKPYGIAIDRARHRLWVTLPGQNRLLALRLSKDGQFGRITTSLPTVRQPNTVAVDESRGRVFVAGRAAGELQTITAKAR